MPAFYARNNFHLNRVNGTSKEDELFRIKGVFAMDVDDVIGNAADDTTAVVIVVSKPLPQPRICKQWLERVVQYRNVFKFVGYILQNS